MSYNNRKLFHSFALLTALAATLSYLIEFSLENVILSHLAEWLLLLERIPGLHTLVHCLACQLIAGQRVSSRIAAGINARIGGSTGQHCHILWPISRHGNVVVVRRQKLAGLIGKGSAGGATNKMQHEIERELGMK